MPVRTRHPGVGKETPTRRAGKGEVGLVAWRHERGYLIPEPVQGLSVFTTMAGPRRVSSLVASRRREIAPCTRRLVGGSA